MSDERDPRPATGNPTADPTKALRPKDAATLILVDRSGDQVRVLMGRRRDDLVFMPGKYVFPGGRVDAADRQLASSYALPSSETAKLLLEMKGEPSVTRATALALAAVRETFEEAGLIIGSPVPPGSPRAGEARDDVWQPFLALGFEPHLDAVCFFARAITPPGRPRRFDTRFFWARAEAVAHKTETNDGELSALHWLSVEEARALDVPTITRVILDDLVDHLQNSEPSPVAGRETTAVPFYHQRNGSFRRDLLRIS